MHHSLILGSLLSRYTQIPEAADCCRVKKGHCPGASWCQCFASTWGELQEALLGAWGPFPSFCNHESRSRKLDLPFLHLPFPHSHTCSSCPTVVVELMFYSADGSVSYFMVDLLGWFLFVLQISGRTDIIYLCTELFSLMCLYWYRNGIFHRDVKPENILIKVMYFVWRIFKWKWNVLVYFCLCWESNISLGIEAQFLFYIYITLLYII